MKRPTPENTSDRLVERIRGLYLADKFDSRSAAIVSTAPRRHPRDPDILLVVAEYRDLAAGHRGIYHCDLHERAYRRVLKLAPENAKAWENLAAVFDIGGRLAEAARAAQKAIRFGDGPNAVALLSRIRAQQGRKAEARRLAKSIRRTSWTFARNTAAEVLKGDWDPF